MKNYFIILFLIIFNVGCFGRVNTDKIVIDNAKLATYEDFFNHMTSNKWFEKMRNKNYYIFQASDEKYIYYGKLIKNNKELEIYKVDKKQLKNKFPNYKDLHGFTLAQIIETDYRKRNSLEYNNTSFYESSFILNGDIIESKIKLWYYKENKSKELIELNYGLDCKDFSILNRE